MARRCAMTGKGVLVGHNVSHANNRTKRRFLPNLQDVSLLSDALGRSVRVRLTANGLRTVERHGGLDGYLLAAKVSQLPDEAVKLRRRVERALAKKTAA
jgi:large subunit ribosomal protein L28